MEKLKDLSEIKHQLIEAVKVEIAGGVKGVDTEEMGAVVDMIKDIASAEKDCMEAAYYELVCEAMDEGESERMGYDRWRYSSGRFAPKGRGHRVRGYLPPYMEDGMADDPMGYARMQDRRSDGATTRSNGRSMPDGMTRRGYHDTEMHDGMTSRQKIDKAIDTMGDIWADATAEERRTMKTLVKDLLEQMEQN